MSRQSNSKKYFMQTAGDGRGGILIYVTVRG